MKKVLFILAAAVSSLITASCAREIIPEEVLQLPEHASIYTSYNMWYEDPSDIDSLNIQKGEILPFGTEVNITSATERKIKFRTVKDNREFVITYNKRKNIIPIEDFMKKYFVTKDPEEMSLGIKPLVYEKIKRGIVEPGMSRGEVTRAYGPPAAFRTPSESVDTWVYWVDSATGKRVIFNGNKVSEVIVLEK